VRVAIDSRQAFARERTGIGYYVSYLLRLLPVVDPTTTYVAWYPSARAALHLKNRRRLDHRAPNLLERVTPIPSAWFEALTLRSSIPRAEWMVRFDVFFAPNFLPPPTRTRHLVLTVHDLAFRLFPDSAPMATRERLSSRLGPALQRASRVIAVSEHTRQDLLDSYGVEPDRVSVIPLGVDFDVFRPASEDAVREVRRRFGIDGPYVVTLGAVEPRKGLPSIVRAYAALDVDVRPTLVHVGPVVAWNPEGWETLRPVLDDLSPSTRRGIVFTGYVSDEDKVALLSGAEALIYTSLYEGFGLPIVEAMACGTPVLTSNVSASPETAGGAALLVDPTDEASITAGIERLLTDTSLRERLRVAGIARSREFSWTRTSVKTAEVLHAAAERS
jgi:glycosyltransferase involved in cell wall biosynthesis